MSRIVVVTDGETERREFELFRNLCETRIKAIAEKGKKVLTDAINPLVSDLLERDPDASNESYLQVTAAPINAYMEWLREQCVKIVTQEREDYLKRLPEAYKNELRAMIRKEMLAKNEYKKQAKKFRETHAQGK